LPRQGGGGALGLVREPHQCHHCGGSNGVGVGELSVVWVIQARAGGAAVKMTAVARVIPERRGTMRMV